MIWEYAWALNLKSHIYTDFTANKAITVFLGFISFLKYLNVRT